VTADSVPDSAPQEDNSPQQTINTPKQVDPEEGMAELETSTMDILDAASEEAPDDEAKIEADDSTSARNGEITEAAPVSAEAPADGSSEHEAVLTPTATVAQGEEQEPADGVGVGTLSEQGPEPTTAGSADPPKEQASGTLNFFLSVYPASLLHISRRFQ
jgi:hypothetical protein